MSELVPLEDCERPRGFEASKVKKRWAALKHLFRPSRRGDRSPGKAEAELSVPLLIEPSVQNMVALLGTLGLGLGFALKDFVSSLVAGLVAVWEMPYRNGD